MAKRRWRWLLWLGLLALVIGGITCLVYGFWASTFNMEAVKEMPSRSTVYDLDGKVYSRLQGENRIVVPLAKVSKHFLDALLAREDARFYQHRGIDPIGIVRAIVRNLVAGSAAQGASTLTQQLARNSYPERIGPKKSLHRKLLEAFVSTRIEQHYSKDEILEAYVNRIYFGTGLYGIETASLAYFGKHASDLSLSEAAMIAGIIRAPTYCSPFHHPERATKSRDAVLDRMVKQDKISEPQAAAARATRLAISRKRPLQTQENYAMDAVARDLNVLLTDDQRAQGGLKIYTTLDPSLQKAMEQSVDAQLRKVEGKAGYAHPRKAEFTDQQREDEAQTPYLQGAAVTIDNKTGAIRALVGGRDYAESKYNRALLASRQVGSTFKPFVYAAAFRHGLLPGGWIDDGPIARGELREAPTWSPDNSDNTNKGTLHAEEGLIQSRNTMSVRVGQRAGLDDVIKTGAAVGFHDIPHQPAIYLGTFETTLTQMTAAYTIFPNGGLRRQSYIIERIDDASGEMIYRAAHVQAPALDPGVTWLVTNILTRVLERGTAASARALGWTRPAAGKTGTTNEFRDAWFIGFTGSLTTGVWVGFDKPQTIVAKGYGAALALPIWVDVMNSAAAQPRYPAAALRSPVPLERVQVCASSSELATSGCEKAGSSYSIELPASCSPRDPCHIHRGGAITAPDNPGDRNRPPSGILRSFRRFFGGD